MLLEFVILGLSIVLGVPLVILGGSTTRKMIARMAQISTLSAWVGRIGVGVGSAISVLIGLTLLVTGHGFFAPLAAVCAALLVELVAALQLRTGIETWERGERAKGFIEGRGIMRQIEERLSAPNLPRIEKSALRLQRFLLRAVGLGSI